MLATVCPDLPCVQATERPSFAVTNALGILLFALGIALTIGLHEFGHLWVAKRSGMHVRRFAIGFGPKVWGFQRGETEYSLRLIPLGGFCDIAGMTTSDTEIDPQDPRAMWRKPVAARVATLLGGVVMNLIVACVVLYGLAVVWGLPNLDQRVTVAKTDCVAAQLGPSEMASCSGIGPAATAGILAGDRIASIDGHATTAMSELFTQLQDAHAAGQDTVTVTVDRPRASGSGFDEETFTVALEETTRLFVTGRDDSGELIHEPREVVAIGIERDTTAPTIFSYNALTAAPAAVGFTGKMVELSWQGLISIPEKVPGVIRSLAGAEREVDSPMSVVGASRVGGDLVERGQWPNFFLMLANLNVFLALFNLIPLPPLDGGHIAVIAWEKLRDFIRRRRGLAALGPVNYERITPITLGVTAVLLVFGVLVIGADIVNPIRLFI